MQNSESREKRTRVWKDDELRRSITVVPKASWLILIGGILLMSGILLWVLGGMEVTTATISGIYHPGGSGSGEVICFPGLSIGKRLDVGMEANVYVPSFDYSEYGNMTGKITYVDDYVTTLEEINGLVDDSSLAQAYYAYSPVVCVVCKLDEDPGSLNGFSWTAAPGETVSLKDGTLMNVYVTMKKERSSSFLLK